MKKCVNGQYFEMTQEEIASLTRGLPSIPYKDRVINRIRDVYSMDDEIAIIRQRDIKPEEFKAYNDFVEKIKQEEKGK